MSNPPVAPWYAHDDVGAQGRQRLLLITAHFPPDSAVGARRWEKLAQYAAERGWGIDVITREPDTEGPLDRSRMASLPTGVRIYRVPVVRRFIERLEDGVAAIRRGRQSNDPGVAPGALETSLMSKVGQTKESLSVRKDDIEWEWTPRGVLRGYWAWLDFAQLDPWCSAAAKLAERIVHPDTHLAIISSGPPHMMHEAGRRASVRTGVPFVMDMRDPWSQNERIIERVASPVWYRMASRYERRAVDRSSLVVANTDHANLALQQVYPTRRRDIVTVMNGADEDPLPPSRHGGRFVIAHAGTIYLDRNPRALFQAAAQVIRELHLTPDQFGLEFIGAVGMVQQERLEEYVRIGPALPFAKAMEFMANATMLLTMSGNNMAAIPAKTFECVRFEAWVLALSAPGSATALLLAGSGADVVAPNDAEGIAEVLRQRYQQHVQGVIPPRIGDDLRFSRRLQAEILFTAIAERKQHIRK